MPLIIEVARRLAEAKAVWIMTGAGVSAESGIPTFRGKDGFWGKGRVEDLATPEAFSRDPKMVWEFYLWRRRNLLTCHPNPAHFAIAEIEKRKPQFHLITQNVDGLHRRAGSRNIAELHGALFLDRCTACRHERRFDECGQDVPGFEPPDCEHIPHCPECGEMMRPGVVWFGEALPMAALAATERAVTSCDMCLVIGTSGVVYPAAGYVEQSSVRGAFAVEINVEATALSAVVDTTLTGKAGEIMPAIVAAMKEMD